MVPSIYLINGNDAKSTIMDSQMYLTFTDMFFARTVHHAEPSTNNNDKIRNGDLGDGEQIIQT